MLRRSVNDLTIVRTLSRKSYLSDVIIAEFSELVSEREEIQSMHKEELEKFQKQSQAALKMYVPTVMI